jgi:hypothetical protein
VSRQFTDATAVRRAVPCYVGLIGPSGSGKTYSALRLATGAAKVLNSDIWLIDSQGTQASAYAPAEGEPMRPGLFNFRRVPLEPPHDPGSYLEALEHCIGKGARVIVVDSGSDEHDGSGGVLEMQDAEWERLGRRDATKFLSWVKPKQERRKLISFLRRQTVMIFFCFRAKEQLLIEKGKDPKKMGWTWIGGDEYAYEMTMRCLLLPGSDGVPEWLPMYDGEKAAVRLPEQFRSMFRPGSKVQLTEAIGEAMARWASGEMLVKLDPDRLPALLAAIEMAPDLDALKSLLAQAKGPWSDQDKQAITQAKETRKAELS